MEKRKKRSENITDEHISLIIGILDGWVGGKLTWDFLIEFVEIKTQQHYTRQTLSKHTKIKMAYDVSKKRLAEAKGKEYKNTLSNDMLVQKIQRLESENLRLENENTELLSQFARWSYNSYSNGITIDELDKPLSSIDRT
jgi:hypothetical protein